jgi:hypothetical protein
MKTTILALVIALSLSVGGCSKNVSATPPNPLNTGATITLDLARGIRLVEDGIRQANSAGVASNEVTASVLRLTVRINKAGQDANSVLRSQVNLSPDQKVSLRTLLDPLVSAIQSAIDQDIVKITNPATRDQVKASLLAIQLTIKSTIAALTPTARVYPGLDRSPIGYAFAEVS